MFILGLGPISEGSVSTLVTASAFSGGIRDRILKLIKGFLTGSRPNDSISLRPRILRSIQ